MVEFEDEHNFTRGTVRNQLAYLVEGNKMERRKHASGTIILSEVGQMNFSCTTDREIDLND